MKRLLILLLLSIPAMADPKIANLQSWYDGYNEEYFNNSLPSNTVVMYGENGTDAMALTFKSGDHLIILISYHYNPASRGALLTLQHEMCHVQVRDEFDMHGPRWKKCMHNLADQGAMDDLW